MKLICTGPILILLTILSRLLLPAIAHAEITAPTVTQFPFSDNFEAATIRSDWATETLGLGRVEIVNEAPHSGVSSIFLGSRATGEATASIELLIDLTGQVEVFLDFWIRSTGDARDSTNGIFISDGINSKKIATLNNISRSYGHFVYDIGTIATANGIARNPTFSIKFNYDDFNLNAGGLFIDDLRLTTHNQAVGTFPLQETFELPNLQTGIYHHSTQAVGASEINGNNPRSGTGQLFIGSKTAGEAGGRLDILVDLSNQPSVFLDFWMRGTGSTADTNNHVSISDGTNSLNIGGINDMSRAYGHYVYDIGAVAAANGLALNNRFLIQIHYDDFNQQVGGIFIDDLRVVAHDQAIAAFPLHEPFESPELQKGLYHRSWQTVGISEINSDAPYSGTHQLFIGSKTAGEGGGRLNILVNLAGQESVYLDFWIRSTGNAGDRFNAIVISDWVNAKEVRNLSGLSRSYQHVILDIAEIASANGLTLTDRFLIQIHFDDFNQQAGGFYIDELTLHPLHPDQRNPPQRIYLPLIQN